MKSYSIILLFIIFFVFGSQFLWANSNSVQSLSPDKAFELLKAGNRRFVENNRNYLNQDQGRRHETATGGQHPFATVMTCSDSRVPVEHIFDVGLGDIFTIRVAGNVSDIDEIGSIEYGIEHLNTPVLVILGHTSCGAVTAVYNGDQVSDNIYQLVDNIVPAVETIKARKPSGSFGDIITLAVKENVWQSISDLFSHSEAARHLVITNKLRVIGALYHLDDGTIEWMGEHPVQSALVNHIDSAKNTSNFLPLILVSSIVLVLLLLFFYKLVISSKSWYRKINIKNRIIISFIILTGLLVLFILVDLFVYSSGSFINLDSLSLIGIVGPLFLLVAFFTVVYCREILRIFRVYIKSVKAQG